MQSKQYFTKIKNYPHEKSTEPQRLTCHFEDHMRGEVGENGLSCNSWGINIC